MIPKNARDWLVWRFQRFSGPPSKLKLDEILEDAIHDLKIQTDLTKAQITSLIKKEIQSMVATRELFKEDNLYVGDFIHPMKESSKDNIEPYKREVKDLLF